MNPPRDLGRTKLRDAEREALEGFVKDVEVALGPSLQSLCLYGSAARGDYRPGRSDLNVLIVVDAVDLKLLARLLEPLSRVRRARVSPLVVSRAEMHASTDVFPITFLAIREAYRLLAGDDVLASLEIRPEHLRLRCEQELREVLRDLRRRYLGSGGAEMAQALISCINPLLETLRATIAVIEGSAPPRAEVVDASARVFGIDADVLRQVIVLRSHDEAPDPARTERLYDRLMSLVQTVCERANQGS